MTRLRARNGVTVAHIGNDEYPVVNGYVHVPTSAVATLIGPVHQFVEAPNDIIEAGGSSPAVVALPRRKR